MYIYIHTHTQTYIYIYMYSSNTGSHWVYPFLILPHLELSWRPGLTSSEDTSLPPFRLKLLNTPHRTQ